MLINHYICENKIYLYCILAVSLSLLGVQGHSHVVNQRSVQCCKV